MFEDKGFNEQKLAALVASKVYYHLGAFNDSVHYALCAGNLFDVNDRSEYVETIIGRLSSIFLEKYSFLLSTIVSVDKNKLSFSNLTSGILLSNFKKMSHRMITLFCREKLFFTDGKLSHFRSNDIIFTASI